VNNFLHYQKNHLQTGHKTWNWSVSWINFEELTG